MRDAAWRGVAAAFLLNGLLFGVWAGRVPAFKEGFALSDGALGLLLLALAGGAILSFPLAGAASERVGPRRLTLALGAAYPAALVLLAAAPNPLALGAALAMFGALHGAMDVAMNGWGAQVEARLARSAMPVFHACFSLGAGLGALSGYAVAGSLEPLPHFLAVAAAGGAGLLWPMLRAPAEGPAREAGPDRPLVALPSGTLLLVGLIALASSMGEGAMADWSAVYLRDLARATEGQAALGYAVFSAVMVATRLSGGWIVARLGAVAAVRFSGLAAACGIAVAVLFPALPTALAGFALVGMGYALVMPLVFSRAASDPDTRPGPALAAVATLGYGGMLLGPPLIGFLAEAAGLRLSFAALAALALLGAALAPHLASGRRVESTL